MQELAATPDFINSAQDTELGEIDVEWAKPPSLAALKKDVQDARTEHSRHISDIDKWLDNLHVTGNAKEKRKTGRSSVVPKVIRRQAEWRYSSLTEPFTANRELFKASPVTWDDKQAAIQNELVLNNQFNNRIDRGEFIDEYVRAAVDQGTVILRLGWDFEDEMREEEQPVFTLTPDPEFGQTIQEVAQLKQENPNAFEFDVPYELKAAMEASMQSGQPLRPDITGMEMVEKQHIIRNEPTIEVCDYRNIVIDPSCQGKTEKAKFIAFTYESCKADLEKDGRFFNLNMINTNANTILGEPDHAISDGMGSFNFDDEARKKFVVTEYWGFLDVEGDGKLLPCVISWVGNTFIQMAQNPYPDQLHPFVVVKYMPVAKQCYGEPDGALLEDHQKVMGAVMRGMIDILARSANAQTGRRRDMLDVANKRKYERGDDYEFNGNVDPRQAFFMHKFEEIPNSSQFMLQLMNAEAEGLTGVKAFSGGLQGGELGDVATAVRGVLDSASKRELGILRRLAAGLVKVGKKVAAMNGEFLSDMEVIRITNEEFIPVRRDELNGEFDLELTISTAEEDDAKAKEIAFILQASGNTIAPGIQKKMLAEMLRLRKMPELAHAIENFQEEPDPMQQKMQELEMAKIDAEIRKIESEVMENEAEAQLDMAKADDLAATTDQKALDFVEQESGVKQERDLQRVGEQARGNIELEKQKQGHELATKAQERNQQTTDTLLKNYIQSTRTSPNQSSNSTVDK